MLAFFCPLLHPVGFARASLSSVPAVARLLPGTGPIRILHAHDWSVATSIVQLTSEQGPRMVFFGAMLLLFR